MGIGRDLVNGLIAGAAGTVALNVTTYLDMALRSRPASPVPAETVEAAAERAGVDLAPGADRNVQQERSQGVGALMGYASGLGFGALYGLLAPRTGAGRPSVPVGATALTLGAMAGANVPATALGVTHPSEWGSEAWAADIIPHALYGLVTAAVHDSITR